jgi:hypothetical protein
VRRLPHPSTPLFQLVMYVNLRSRTSASSTALRNDVSFLTSVRTPLDILHPTSELLCCIRCPPQVLATCPGPSHVDVVIRTSSCSSSSPPPPPYGIRPLPLHLLRVLNAVYRPLHGVYPLLVRVQRRCSRQSRRPPPAHLLMSTAMLVHNYQKLSNRDD